MSKVKRWNGKEWEPAKPKRWNGKEWTDCEVKQWNGRDWVSIAQQTYTKTWSTIWTRSYGHGGSVLKSDALGGRNKMYQGRYGSPDANMYDWGIQKSMAGFDWKDIQANLKDSKIEKVEIYLHNEHFWYYAGGKAFIGLHNASSAPAKFSESSYGVKSEMFSSRGQAKWIEMPKSFAEGLRDGKFKGFTLNRNSHELSYYGYWFGEGSGGREPKIRITYKK